MPGVFGWALFGAGVRFWQLGIEMRPFFSKETALGYPIFMAVSGAFGYWLQGVQNRQVAILAQRRDELLEKRRRAGYVVDEPGVGVGRRPVGLA